MQIEPSMVVGSFPAGCSNRSHLQSIQDAVRAKLRGEMRCTVRSVTGCRLPGNGVAKFGIFLVRSCFSSALLHLKFRISRSALVPRIVNPSPQVRGSAPPLGFATFPPRSGAFKNLHSVASLGGRRLPTLFRNLPTLRSVALWDLGLWLLRPGGLKQ